MEIKEIGYIGKLSYTLFALRETKTAKRYDNHNEKTSYENQNENEKIRSYPFNPFNLRAF